MRLAFAALALLAAGLAAQTNRVLPPECAQRDGNTGSAWPFAYSTARCQQLIDGGALCRSSCLLTALAYRRDGAASGTLPAQLLPALKLRLSHTTATPGSMATTFSQNITGLETVVFNGPYNLPAQVAGSPAPFNMTWTFATPFVFARAQGNLLVDFEIGGTLGKNSYSTDAESSNAGWGLALVYGTAGVFSGQDAYSFTCENPARLVPGGQTGLKAAGLLQNYPALAVLGLSNQAHAGLPLPLDLGPFGAPGNAIHASILAMLPLPLAQSAGLWSGSVPVAVPNDPWLPGASLYAQAWFVHAASNPLGLVTSSGLALTVGFQGPAMQVVGNYDPTALSGSKPSTPTGQATQFTGVFN